MVDGLVEACLAVYENALRLLSYLVVSFVPPWSGRGRRFPRPNFSPQIWELLRGYSHTQTNKQEPCHFQCFQSNILILQIFISTFPESPLCTSPPDRPWCQKNRHASWSRGASENFFDTHISCPNCGKKRVFFEAHVPTSLHCPGFLVPILHKMLFLAQASLPLPACFIPVTVDREKSCVTLCTAIASARQKRACRSRPCLMHPQSFVLLPCAILMSQLQGFSLRRLLPCRTWSTAPCRTSPCSGRTPWISLQTPLPRAERSSLRSTTRSTPCLQGSMLNM